MKDFLQCSKGNSVENSLAQLHEKMNHLEKKIDLLSMSLERQEKFLFPLQPLLKALSNLPFIK